MSSPEPLPLPTVRGSGPLVGPVWVGEDVMDVWVDPLVRCAQ